MKVLIFWALILGSLVRGLWGESLQASVELQPHRAYYKVTMEGRPNPQSSLVDVQGTMLIEFEETPEGWIVQQISDTRFYHQDESVEYVRLGYVTYEAKNGSFFTFNTHRKINGEVVEDIRGKAEKKGNHIIVRYQKPEKKELALQEDVLFPTQHIKSLLTAAQGGEHVFPCIVFDGSRTEGALEINTFLGTQKVIPTHSSTQETHQFASHPFWPVRLAAYGLEKKEYDPLYVATQELLPNGIIKQYVIDYGDTKLQGTLERIELLRSK